MSKKVSSCGTVAIAKERIDCQETLAHVQQALAATGSPNKDTCIACWLFSTSRNSMHFQKHPTCICTCTLVLKIIRIYAWLWMAAVAGTTCVRCSCLLLALLVTRGKHQPQKRSHTPARCVLDFLAEQWSMPFLTERACFLRFPAMLHHMQKSSSWYVGQGALGNSDHEQGIGVFRVVCRQLPGSLRPLGPVHERRREKMGFGFRV